MFQRLRYGRAVALTIALFALAGCQKATGTDESGQRIKIGMVTDIGGLGDRSFNDSAYDGLTRAKTKLGASVEALESKSAAEYQPNLTALCDEEYDEIFAIGYLMASDVALVARQNPKRSFAIVDAVVDAPNVASITFREQDASFLAGAAAAMASKTKTIAFLGGIDIPLLRKFESGYAAGAREIDPKIHVLVKYVGSFDDVPSGKELASVLYHQGADVVYVAAGKSGLGAFDEVRAHPGDFVIGVDSNQDGIVPGQVLTSVVKRIDNAVFRTSIAVANRKPPTGHVEYGLADGGVDVTDFKYTKAALGPANLRRLAELRRAIVDGRILPPATRDELARFTPVAL